ncbi:MAG TPA: 50S ribosomal protein L25 [Thermoanaerobaculia bacterium]|jgi:large subunit ribosomal protein L25
MSHVNIEVEKRETRGKNANRQLRAAGRVPAVVYGGAREPVAIHLGKRQIEELLKTTGGENAVFLLKLAGTEQSRHTMLREIQQDAITGGLIHVDFQRVSLDETVRVAVSIELQGEAFGVKNESGLLDFVTREVEVECLPDKIPSRLVVDVSELHVGQHVEARQLPLPAEVKLLVEPERVIASLVARRGLGLDEEAAEGEALLEQIAAEPEVIKRGKAEDEG